MEYFFVFSALPLELGSFSVLVTRVCAMPVFFTLSLSLVLIFYMHTQTLMIQMLYLPKKATRQTSNLILQSIDLNCFFKFFLWIFFSKNFLFSLLYQNVMLLFSLFFRCDVFCSHAQNM